MLLITVSTRAIATTHEIIKIPYFAGDGEDLAFTDFNTFASYLLYDWNVHADQNGTREKNATFQ